MVYYFDPAPGLKIQMQLEPDQISVFVFLSQNQETTKNKAHKQKPLALLALLAVLVEYRI
jgi:hypothetical protein